MAALVLLPRYHHPYQGAGTVYASTQSKGDQKLVYLEVIKLGISCLNRERDICVSIIENCQRTTAETVESQSNLLYTHCSPYQLLERRCKEPNAFESVRR